MTTQTYDYIVVGAGTAGSVIATRLTEDPAIRVLLIEAGAADPLPEMTVPPAWLTLLRSSATWGDSSTVQTAAGAPVPLFRGRGLGGSSSINAMIFARGHRSGYDAWPAAGAEGWGFDDLLPYFRRSENAPGRDPALRGLGGPLTVGPAHPPNPVIAAALAAAAETGHPIAEDISGGLEEGFGLPDLNVVGGLRQSAADAYLRPVLDRPNLTVIADTVVDRVVIEGDRAVGVGYSSGDGRTTQARAAREVVLCAGAVGSAQLLMLSGVGPASHLAEVGVPVVLDLPGVGANFHDHPLVYVVHRASRPVPAGRFNHGEGIGLVRSDPGLDHADLQIMLIDVPAAVPGPKVEHGYSFGVSVVAPYSRGTVRLSGNRPGDRPLLDPNYFGDERDLRAMVAGLRIARRIGAADALAPWQDAELAPGPEVDSDEALAEYARQGARTYYHLVGSCAMGRGPMAVVDTDLRVRGLDGLRVADGSVIPAVPSANTNATVCAIAERAADLLRP